MTKYKLKINPQINKQLEQHGRFIAQVSNSAATRFQNDFKIILRQISSNPYQFPPYDNPAFPENTYRKALFAKWYKVIFLVDGDTVYLEAVIDGRQDSGI